MSVSQEELDSALLHATCASNIEEMQHYIAAGATNIAECLLYATNNQQVKAIRYLASIGIDLHQDLGKVKSFYRGSYTALHYAINGMKPCFSDITLTLLELGANPLIEDGCGATALNYAITDEKFTQYESHFIQAILHHKHPAALHEAAKNLWYTGVKSLLEHGYNPNEQFSNQPFSPLQCVLLTDKTIYEKIIRIMVKENNSPFGVACQKAGQFHDEKYDSKKNHEIFDKQVKLIKLLIEYDAVPSPLSNENNLNDAFSEFFPNVSNGYLSYSKLYDYILYDKEFKEFCKTCREQNELNSIVHANPSSDELITL